MTESIKEPYEDLYDEFITKYNKTEVSPSDVGEVLTRIAGYFPNYNQEMVKADRSYSLIKRDNILKTDEVTGKAITATKSDTISDASSEAFIYKKARMHVQNIEMLIGSLKFLQKSLEVEYLNSNT